VEDLASTIKPNPLRQWRNGLGKRAVDVALMLGLSERAILAYETGAFKPAEGHLDAIAKLMKLKSVDDLKTKWNDWLESKRNS